MRQIALQPAALLLPLFAAACSGPATSTLDSEPSATELSDAADCWVQAARQAERSYPRQPLDDPGYGVRRPAAVADDPAKAEAATLLPAVHAPVGAHQAVFSAFSSSFLIGCS